MLPQRQRKRRHFDKLIEQERVERRLTQYEYLDHTADVQLHAWGATWEMALEQIALSLFGYMTNLDKVAVEEGCEFEIHVKGHDKESMLYNFLNEWLYLFGTKDFIGCAFQIELNLDSFECRALG